MAPLSIGTVAPDAPPGTVRIEGLRDARYGEVFLGRSPDGRLELEVWNTLGLNECPQEAWDALEPTELARENEADVVILNGPRHWLLDAIENVPRADRQVARFGELDFFLAAAIDFGDEPPTSAPYARREIQRDTVWEWSPGRTVHELVDDEGAAYVMQAYCLAVEPAQTEDSLGDLGARLAVPEGWAYRSRQLDDALRVRSHDGVGVVIQDELQNTYHLIA